MPGLRGGCSAAVWGAPSLESFLEFPCPRACHPPPCGRWVIGGAGGLGGGSLFGRARRKTKNWNSLQFARRGLLLVPEAFPERPGRGLRAGASSGHEAPGGPPGSLRARLPVLGGLRAVLAGPPGGSSRVRPLTPGPLENCVLTSTVQGIDVHSLTWGARVFVALYQVRNLVTTWGLEGAVTPLPVCNPLPRFTQTQALKTKHRAQYDSEQILSEACLIDVDGCALECWPHVASWFCAICTRCCVLRMCM